MPTCHTGIFLLITVIILPFVSGISDSFSSYVTLEKGKFVVKKVNVTEKPSPFYGDDILQRPLIPVSPDDLRYPGSPMDKINGFLWPNNMVPFRIDFSTFNPSLIELVDRVISGAFKMWEDNTCLRFPKMATPAEIPPEAAGGSLRVVGDNGGCSSYVGRVQVDQVLSIGRGCLTTDTVLHEIGHAIGLIHEQSRGDRDDYVEIFPKSIIQRALFNFEKDAGQTMWDRIPYAYDSVMHYRRAAFSIDRFENIDTLLPRNPAYNDIIGGVNGLSFYDIKAINVAYECGKSCETLPCQNGGYPYRDGPVCSCKCPRGLGGAFCSKIDSLNKCGEIVELSTSIGINSFLIEHKIPGRECIYLFKVAGVGKLRATVTRALMDCTPHGYNWKPKQTFELRVEPTGQLGIRMCIDDLSEVKYSDQAELPQDLRDFTQDSRELMFILPSLNTGQEIHISVTAEADACLKRPCRNGGTCSNSPDGSEYTCLCHSGYESSDCALAREVDILCTFSELCPFFHPVEGLSFLPRIDMTDENFGFMPIIPLDGNFLIAPPRMSPPGVGRYVTISPLQPTGRNWCLTFSHMTAGDYAKPILEIIFFIDPNSVWVAASITRETSMMWGYESVVIPSSPYPMHVGFQWVNPFNAAFNLPVNPRAVDNIRLYACDSVAGTTAKPSITVTVPTIPAPIPAATIRCGFEKPSDWCGMTSMEGFSSWEGGPNRKTVLLRSLRGFVQSTQGQHYSLYDSSERSFGDVARQITGDMPKGSYCVTFIYYLFGKDFTEGKLRFGTFSEDGAAETQTYWNAAGSRGQEWIFVAVNVTLTKTKKIFFDAVHGGSRKSDVAIDDVNIEHGQCAYTFLSISRSFEDATPTEISFTDSFASKGFKLEKFLGTIPFKAHGGTSFLLASSRGSVFTAETRLHFKVPPESKDPICVQFFYRVHGIGGRVQVVTSSAVTNKGIVRVSTSQPKGRWVLKTLELPPPALTYTSISIGAKRTSNLFAIFQRISIGIDDVSITSGKCQLTTLRRSYFSL